MQLLKQRPARNEHTSLAVTQTVEQCLVANVAITRLLALENTIGGKALTRDHLLEQVWGHDPAYEIDTRTIDQHIARLRDKLGPEAKRVITVKNVGYRFDTE